MLEMSVFSGSNYYTSEDFDKSQNSNIYGRSIFEDLKLDLRSQIIHSLDPLVFKKKEIFKIKEPKKSRLSQSDHSLYFQLMRQFKDQNIDLSRLDLFNKKRFLSYQNLTKVLMIEQKEFANYAYENAKANIWLYNYLPHLIERYVKKWIKKSIQKVFTLYPLYKNYFVLNHNQVSTDAILQDGNNILFIGKAKVLKKNYKVINFYENREVPTKENSLPITEDSNIQILACDWSCDVAITMSTLIVLLGGSSIHPEDWQIPFKVEALREGISAGKRLLLFDKALPPKKLNSRQHLQLFFQSVLKQQACTDEQIHLTQISLPQVDGFYESDSDSDKLVIDVDTDTVKRQQKVMKNQEDMMTSSSDVTKSSNQSQTSQIARNNLATIPRSFQSNSADVLGQIFENSVYQQPPSNQLPYQPKLQTRTLVNPENGKMYFYRLWILGEFRILIRGIVHAQRYEKNSVNGEPQNLVFKTKVDYQSNLGYEQLTFQERLCDWLILKFYPQPTTILRYRINPILQKVIEVASTSDIDVVYSQIEKGVCKMSMKLFYTICKTLSYKCLASDYLIFKCKQTNQIAVRHPHIENDDNLGLYLIHDDYRDAGSFFESTINNFDYIPLGVEKSMKMNHLPMTFDIEIRSKSKKKNHKKKKFRKHK